MADVGAKAREPFKIAEIGGALVDVRNTGVGREAHMQDDRVAAEKAGHIDDGAAGLSICTTAELVLLSAEMSKATLACMSSS